MRTFKNRETWLLCCFPMGASSLSRVRLFATPWTKPTRLLCPWDSPGKSTGVSCHFLLQGIFLIQGSNPRVLCPLHCRRVLCLWSHPGSITALCQCKCDHVKYYLKTGCLFRFHFSNEFVTKLNMQCHIQIL